MFGTIFYRQTSSPTLLQRARNEIQELFPSSGNFTPTRLVIATWDRVAEFVGVSEVHNFYLLFTYCNTLLHNTIWTLLIHCGLYTFHCYCRKTHSRLWLQQMDSGHLCSSFMVKLNGVLPILASMLEMVSDLLLVQHRSHLIQWTLRKEAMLAGVECTFFELTNVQ